MIKIRIDMDTVNKMLMIPESKEELVESWLHIIENGFIFNEFIIIDIN